MFFTNLCAQERNNQYRLELTSDISNQWWSNYNSYGQNPSEIYFNYKNMSEYDNIFLKTELVATENKIYIAETFIQSKLFNNFHIKVGNYYRDFSSYLNDTLSSGSLLISKNAQPMPKVGILSSFKFKKNQNFNFDFGITHGIFATNKIYETAPMLHEKFIYLNYSKNQNNFSIGFVHEAMWGGSTKEYGKFPNSFKDFLKIFIAADGPFFEGQSHANALGNHLGIWDFSYKRRIMNNELKLYYQHFFEDTSGLRFDNKSDGLWGIELTNLIKNTNILFEYLNTTNQYIDPPYINERYYYHYEYQEGWTYKDYSIGNPFFNDNPSKFFHLGMSADQINKYSYKLLLSRKIDSSDSIKYQLSFGKMINKYFIGVIVNGEETNGSNMTIKLSYEL